MYHSFKRILNQLKKLYKNKKPCQPTLPSHRSWAMNLPVTNVKTAITMRLNARTWDIKQIKRITLHLIAHRNPSKVLAFISSMSIDSVSLKYHHILLFLHSSLHLSLEILSFPLCILSTLLHYCLFYFIGFSLGQKYNGF